MKPFNLEEAKAGKPICTRDGRAVRIICFDAAMSYPIVALVHEGGADGKEEIIEYGDAGQFNYTTAESCNDLFINPKTTTVWVNLYRIGVGAPFVGENTYESEQAAILGRSPTRNCIGTFPVTYEE